MADQEAFERLCADLLAEFSSVDELVAGLDEEEWTTPTPAAGWTIKDQVGHLASVDAWAESAAVNPEGFREWRDSLDPGLDLVEATVEEARDFSSEHVLEWLREQHVTLQNALRQLDASARVPWFGPDMSASSLVTARIMETWAHGEDIAEALGVTRPPTSRLRHVAHLGVRTRGYAYASRGLPVPTTDVRVELIGPELEQWEWGPEDAPDYVGGRALDFCLVVCRRRHLSDTSLVVTGPTAAEWLSIAQAFAGPSGKDPSPKAQ